MPPTRCAGTTIGRARTSSTLAPRTSSATRPTTSARRGRTGKTKRWELERKITSVVTVPCMSFSRDPTKAKACAAYPMCGQHNWKGEQLYFECPEDEMCDAAAQRCRKKPKWAGGEVPDWAT